MKYLLVYSDEYMHPNNLFDTIHIDKVSHKNLIGKTYFDVFVTIDCFPTEEQLFGISLLFTPNKMTLSYNIIKRINK